MRLQAVAAYGMAACSLVAGEVSMATEAATGVAVEEASSSPVSTSPLPTVWTVTRPGAEDGFLGSTVLPDLVDLTSAGAHYLYRHARDMVLGLVLVGFLALIGATKGLWFPPIYQQTFAEYNCPAARSCDCLAWLCSSCCWCWCPAYHPAFRLRVVVHEGRNFKGTLCHIAATCGSNPPKTTSAQAVPTSSAHYPVVWNEPLELEVSTADEHVRLLVCEGDRVRGAVTLACSDFFPQFEGSLDDVMYLPERVITKTVVGEQDQCTLVLSLYATRPGTPLPEVMTSLQ